MRLRSLTPLALVALVACSPYTIKYDYDPAAPLTAYRSFDWMKPKKDRVGDAPPRMAGFTDARVKEAVVRELEGKGLRRETSADPDVLLDYFPIYQNRSYTTHTRVGMGTGGYGWGMRTSVGTSQRHRYKEGTLVLQVVDFKTNKLVWEGSAEGALTGLAGRPEEAQEAIAKAVKDLLADFPPRK